MPPSAVTTSFSPSSADTAGSTVRSASRKRPILPKYSPAEPLKRRRVKCYGAAGVWPVNFDAPVKYLQAGEGGVSHFNYVRDNALLTWMHTRLMCGFLLRLPLLLPRRLAGPPR